MLENLKLPFDPKDIEWRTGATNKDKTRALALAYITSRAVMDRLDEVCGPGGWRDEYRPGPSGGVICGISIRVEDEWITKWDGADNTQVEQVKGGLSDAFKRAGVKWGIGRYLYNLEGVWVACEQRGKSVVLSETPRLPDWALPAGATDPIRKHPQGQSPEPNGKAESAVRRLIETAEAHPEAFEAVLKSITEGKMLKEIARKAEQGGPLQWLINEGFAENVFNASEIANLLKFGKHPDQDEQRDLVGIYRAWRNLGSDPKVAATFALEGKLPDEQPEEVE